MWHILLYIQIYDILQKIKQITYDYSHITFSMMNSSNKLSLEQEFQLASYKKQLTKFDKNQSKKYLVATLRQMMIKDNIIKYFIQNSNL